jgi:hypothetical protein
MAYNLVIDQTITEIGYPSEPVTLEEAKAYARVEVSNTAQDILFGLWIQGAREYIEQSTGLSLVPKSIVATLSNPQGGIEVPFGPVTSAITWTDINGNIPTVVTRGASFPLIPVPFDIYIGTYSVGYTNATIPRDLKIAMLNMIVSWYENRGDEATMNAPASVVVICQKYSRIGLIA